MLRINRINIFIFIMLSLLSTTSTAYQSTEKARIESEIAGKIPVSLLNIVSVDLEDVDFETALKTIAEKGKFKLSYNRDRIPLEKEVSLKMDEVAAVEALIKILRDTNTGLIITKKGDIAVVPYAENTFIENKKNVSVVTGIVSDLTSGEPLIGANVIVVGTRKGAATDKNGRFSIPNLQDGIYSLEALYMGYTPQRIDSVYISGETSVQLEFELTEKILSLDEIIVTPGHFSLMEEGSSTTNLLNEEDIKSFSQIGEDIYRAVTRLPGLAGNDFSAKFNIRGGQADETLMLLDGMELYEPFHLKDLDGFFSIIDIETIKGIDMMTGAFPAEYGNKLSGVFNMKTASRNLDKPRTSLAISFLNARVRSEGSFASGDGQWMVLARRGYLDLALKLTKADTDIDPTFGDFFAKTQYIINPKHSVSAHVLTSNDKLDFEDEGAVLKTDYGNYYGWLTWNAQYTSKIFSNTFIYNGKTDADGAVSKPVGLGSDFEGHLRDKNDFQFAGVKQNWQMDVSEKLQTKMGYEFKNSSSHFDFLYGREVNVFDEDGNHSIRIDTTASKAEFSGNSFNAYLSNKFKILEPLTAEAGIRYDQTSWTNDKNWSPRLNAVLSLNAKTSIRAGWGKFYQSQGINKVNVYDGEDNFYPAELAEHFVVGLEHQFEDNISMRVELYQKDLSSIRPRYINYEGPALNIFGYMHDDRMRIEPESGESKGLEIYFHRKAGIRHNWWLSYGLSKVEDVIDGVKVPRTFDQRHTIYFDYNYRPSEKWRFNLAWQFHSGWPYSLLKDRVAQWFTNGGYSIEWYPGPLNAERFDAYHRIDFRMSRYIEINKSRMAWFIEIRNLLNSKHVREYGYRHQGMYSGKTVVAQSSSETWIPLLPSFGISWDF